MNADVRERRKGDSTATSLAPTVLLLSDDEFLVKAVRGVVRSPWKLGHHGAGAYLSRDAFAHQNVRLVIFDDYAVDENDRGWMLAQIRKRFSNAPFLYIAAVQSNANEKRARANGAQYYISKPLSLERFGMVLKSFLQAQHPDRRNVFGLPGPAS